MCIRDRSLVTASDPACDFLQTDLRELAARLRRLVVHNLRTAGTRHASASRRVVMYTDKKIRVRLVGKLHSLVECRIAVIRPGVIHADVLIAVVKNLFQLQHDRQVNVLLIDSLLVRTDGSSSCLLYTSRCV